MTDLSKNSIAIAGEFAVLSQLALRGFDANITLGNTKSVDILASDPKSDRVYRIEVKTSYGKKPSKSSMFGNCLSWFMGEKHETINDPNLFYIFVNFEKETNIPRFFVVPSQIVANHVKKSHEYWLTHKNKQEETAPNIPIRLFRIGVENEVYPVDTPKAEEYENNWDILSL